MHPEHYRGRYPCSEDLDTLIWAWDNIPGVRQHFHVPACGPWGGWARFTECAAAQKRLPPDRVELAQELLRGHGVTVERGRTRVHFTRPGRSPQG